MHAELARNTDHLATIGIAFHNPQAKVLLVSDLKLVSTLFAGLLSLSWRGYNNGDFVELIGSLFIATSASEIRARTCAGRDRPRH
jgi:hypothetical protein